MADLPAYAHSGTGSRLEPDELSATPPPWDLGRPQSAFLGLADQGAIRGRVLDVGCGTGEHVLVAELVESFDTVLDGWRADSIEPTTIEITTDPAGIRAWLVAATRT